MMRMWWTFLLLLDPVSGRSCMTPTWDLGTCTPLSLCPPLLALLTQPILPHNIQFLQQSTCDSSKDEPLVCCSQTTTKTTPQTTTKTTPQTTTKTTPQTTTKTTPQTTTKPTPRPLKGPSTTKRPDPEVEETSVKGVLPGVTECGKSALTSRIAGGMDAGLGSFPWMALLGYSLDGNETDVQFACGGTLITQRYILTAAHCVAKLPEGFKPAVVRLGEYDQKTEKDCDPGSKVCAPPVQDMAIDLILVHEEYDKTGKKENDIALIRLLRKAALGPFVSMVCLPTGERLTPEPVPRKPIVAGWGRLTADNPDGALVLQMVSVPYTKMDKCNAVYKNALGQEVDPGRFCAGGEKGKDSCQGDSGGPLMQLVRPASLPDGGHRILQLGVVSLGPKYCDTAGQPALYTKVPHFMPWIRQHIRP